MDSVFNEDSWKVEEGNLPSKKFDTKNLISNNLFESKTKLKYLKPIFFDEEVRIDLELDGNITLEINDKKHHISTSNLSNKCILVKNGIINCDNIKEGIKLDQSSLLKVVIESDTLIKKFTIVQNMKIDNCNPNN